MDNFLNGIHGIPIKIDKLGVMGSVDDVIKSLKEISKDMENPMVIRLDDTIAVFDLKPLPEIEMPSISTEMLRRKVPGPFDFLPTAQEAGERLLKAMSSDDDDEICAELDPECGA